MNSIAGGARWRTFDQTVDHSHVDNAFAAMLEELDSGFEVRWLSRFSNQQQRIVQALSELVEASLKDIAAKMMVHSPDISAAISRLKDMMILQRRENGSYYITDRVSVDCDHVAILSYSSLGREVGNHLNLHFAMISVIANRAAEQAVAQISSPCRTEAFTAENAELGRVRRVRREWNKNLNARSQRSLRSWGV